MFSIWCKDNFQLFDRQMLLQCLYEVGKNYKITLLDLYCEMLEPELLNSGTPCHFELEKDDHSLFGGLQKGGFVNQIIQIVRYTFLLFVIKIPYIHFILLEHSLYRSNFYWKISKYMEG